MNASEHDWLEAAAAISGESIDERREFLDDADFSRHTGEISTGTYYRLRSLLRISLAPLQPERAA